MQRPIVCSVDAGSRKKSSSLVIERDVDLPEWRRQGVTGRFAHRLLARPQRQEMTTTVVGIETRDRFTLVARHEFARDACDADRTIESFDVDTDAARAGDADDRHTRRVRDVEIESWRTRELWPAAMPALDFDRCSIAAECRREDRAQRAASHHIAVTQTSIAEARGARAFRV